MKFTWRRGGQANAVRTFYNGEIRYLPTLSRISITYLLFEFGGSDSSLELESIVFCANEPYVVIYVSNIVLKSLIKKAPYSFILA